MTASRGSHLGVAIIEVSSSPGRLSESPSTRFVKMRSLRRFRGWPDLIGLELCRIVSKCFDGGSEWIGEEAFLLAALEGLPWSPKGLVTSHFGSVTTVGWGLVTVPRVGGVLSRSIVSRMDVVGAAILFDFRWIVSSCLIGKTVLALAWLGFEAVLSVDVEEICFALLLGYSSL